MLKGLLRVLFRTVMHAGAKPQSFASSEARPISGNLEENIEYIKQLTGNPFDLFVREFKLVDPGHECAVVCIDGLVSKDEINNQVLRSLMRESPSNKPAWPHSAKAAMQLAYDQVISDCDMEIVHTMDEAVLLLMDGCTLLFFDGADQVIAISARKFEGRKVDEPVTEAVIRGPRDGFTETLQVNASLLRRRIRDPNLRLQLMRIGRRGKTPVVIAYIEGIVHPGLVEETIRRLRTIDVDEAEGSGLVEQWIADSYLTPFPLMLSTERPDKATAALLQGKVGIIVDGTPFVLILPITLVNMLQSPEDYYANWISSTFIRILRFGAAFVSTFLPGLYVALLEYHHGMIPSKLVFSIAGAREGVPFPAVIEALAMEITLEVLREAGVRLPKPIGQTIGIVGGLVIGEAAVAAGIVSPIMVIVVSLTAISSFALPSYGFAMSLRIIRFLIMMAAAILGLYGVILAYIMINIHLVNLKSFGIPYTTPFSPAFIRDFTDSIWRAPATMQQERPQMMQTEDKMRQRRKEPQR